MHAHAITENLKKCKICKYTWARKPRGKTSKKEETIKEPVKCM